MRVLKGILVIIFALSAAQAAMVDATRTAILVNDTNSNDPLKLKQAFAQILANNTGEDILSILQNPVFIETTITKGINRSYFEKIDSQYLPAGSDSKYWFHLIMQKSFIASVIKRAQFSLLPHSRQPIILWMAKQDESLTDSGDLMTSDESVNTNIDAPLTVDYAFDDLVMNYWIEKWAAAMTLEIIKPAIDEGDQLFVSPDSIKNLSYEAIEHSKNRYQIEQVLMIFVRKTPQGTKVRSGLTMRDDDMHIKHFQESEMADAGVFYALFNDVAQNYAQKFSISNDKLQNSTVQILFDNINGFDEIQAINQYLTQISVVDKVSVVSASSGTLVINADITINREELLKIVARDQFLMPVENGSFNRLQFRLLQ